MKNFWAERKKTYIYLYIFFVQYHRTASSRAEPYQADDELQDDCWLFSKVIRLPHNVLDRLLACSRERQQKRKWERERDWLRWFQWRSRFDSSRVTELNQQHHRSFSVSLIWFQLYKYKLVFLCFFFMEK